MVGYHGTSIGKAQQVCANGFCPSSGAGEWLGHGVYFWTAEDAAWVWATRFFGEKAAVVEATLVLGHCLDLDQMSEEGRFLREVGAELVRDCEARSVAVPLDEGEEKRLQCAVVNRAAENTSPLTDSVMATCPAGEIIVGTSFRSQTRMQICIRSLQCVHHPLVLSRRNP